MMAADCSNRVEARTGSVTVGVAGEGRLSGETSMLVQFNPQKARRSENGAEWFDVETLFEPDGPEVSLHCGQTYTQARA